MKKVNFELIISVLVLLLLISTASFAEDRLAKNIHLSVFGGLGISNGHGDYPSENDASIEFSFFPGIRLKMDEAFMPETFILVDLGYLETGFVGYVQATDTQFWNTYDYLNLNAMFGSQTEKIYYAGGLYFGIGLGAYSYREYTDDWVDLDSNTDFGIVAEAGTQVASFLNLGIQARYGIKSIGSSVDIKNWAILATFTIPFYRF